jgi:CheY-like chemotaxis protein
MPNGGTFTIRTRNENPSESLMEQFELAPDRDYVRITLRDTGTGIPVALRDKIFEPFFTTKEKGTGLGLAMCYGIVRQSDGGVTFESTPGQGTAFSIYLPAALNRVATEVGATHERDEVRGSETILVVEDEAAVRSLIDRSLRQFGYTVFTARNGTDAMSLVEQQLQELDLLITDLKMPGLGGRALLEELRLRRPRLPALLISGFDANLSGSAALGEGVSFLQKPFTPTSLARAAREALRDSRAESSRQEGSGQE